MLESQRLASLALAEVLAGRSLTSALESSFSSRRRAPSSASDPRPLAQELCYGVLRGYGRLNGYATRLLRTAPESAALRTLILVALYQLDHTRAPDFAVVDSAVKTADALRQPRAKGLVNAVLRNYLRRRTELDAALKDDEVAVFGYPQWWIDKMRRDRPEHWQAILLAGNTHPPMTLRVNRRQTDLSRYSQTLRDSGIEAEPLGGVALRLLKPVGVERLPGFAAGHVSVQDVSAQHAAGLLDIADGMRVLDACAAPGGKTSHLLETADIDLLALDSDPARLRRVEENLARLKFSANVAAADAADVKSWWDGKGFDRILLDVPCTGSGVVKRHPDIKWLRRVADIQQFARQQRRLLDGVWSCLKPHGKLLYVTCSIFGEENDQQVRQFVSRQADASLLPINLPGSDETTGGQIFPNETRDGFFYALLRKE